MHEGIFAAVKDGEPHGCRPWKMLIRDRVYAAASQLTRTRDSRCLFQPSFIELGNGLVVSWDPIARAALGMVVISDLLELGTLASAIRLAMLHAAVEGRLRKELGGRDCYFGCLSLMNISLCRVKRDGGDFLEEVPRLSEMTVPARKR